MKIMSIFYMAISLINLSRDELIDIIKWVGIVVTILICYKGGAFGNKGKSNDKK